MLFRTAPLVAGAPRSLNGSVGYCERFYTALLAQSAQILRQRELE
jgi:hypothetical protein